MSSFFIPLYNLSEQTELVFIYLFLFFEFKPTPSGKPVFPLIHSSLSSTINPARSRPFLFSYPFFYILNIFGLLILNWFVTFLYF